MNSQQIHELIQMALTDKIDDREIFMKGIDYSYYYEQDNWDDEQGKCLQLGVD